MNRSVEDVLFEMVDLCDRFKLSYAVMGGLAVRVHGIPRPTFDVDFELSVNSEALHAFFSSAAELGYTIAEPFRNGWRDEVGGMPLVKMKTYLDVGHSVDVDIFIDETAFQHSVMDRRQQLTIEGRKVQFISAEDLILLKLLANRPRDLGDVADVLFVQGQLDEPYLAHWAEQLGIRDRLQTALTTYN